MCLADLHPLTMAPYGHDQTSTLCLCQNSYGTLPIYFVDLPIQNGEKW